MVACRRTYTAAKAVKSPDGQACVWQAGTILREFFAALAVP